MRGVVKSWLVGWVGYVASHSLLTLLSITVATVIFAWVAITQFQINSDLSPGQVHRLQETCPGLPSELICRAGFSGLPTAGGCSGWMSSVSGRMHSH